MTTRSRTLLFLQYRNSYSRVHKTSQQHGDTSEKAGLIENESVDTHLPPQWIDVVDDVDEAIVGIKEKMQELEQLHRKHLLPGFDDRTREEQLIDRITTDITQRFQSCQKKVKKIQDTQRNIASNEQRKLSLNVQTRLATRLQELSADFRKQQSIYLQSTNILQSD
jgi:syntaxin 16